MILTGEKMSRFSNAKPGEVRCFAMLIFLLFCLSGCLPGGRSADKIEVGMTRADVRAHLGEPEEIQPFFLRDERLFGPQEELIGLVPFGTTVEEWVFRIGDDNFYVWFGGEPDQPAADWTVIAVARYPVDAVF